MSIPLKYSTAGQYVYFGPFVDSTDGVTPETALTINASDIKLTKYGATSQVSKNSGGATHMAGGVYYAILDATDSNTLGELRIDIQKAGAAPWWCYYCVHAVNVYNAYYGDGSDYVDADAFGIKDYNQTALAVGAATVTLVNGTNTKSGDFIRIVSATTGAGQMKQVLSVDTSVSTAHVATVDANWSPALTGTVAYISYHGPGTPTTPPDTNVKRINGTPVTGSGASNDKWRA
jgi:hypothetical protein